MTLLDEITALNRDIDRVCNVMVEHADQAGVDVDDPGAVWDWARTAWPELEPYVCEVYQELTTLLGSSSEALA